MTRRNRSTSWVLAGVLVLVAGACGACDDSGTGGTKSQVRPASPGKSNEPTLAITFTYGSEKENWIKDVTAAFNGSGVKTKSGKRVTVDAIPLGSGESIDEL